MQDKQHDKASDIGQKELSAVAQKELEILDYWNKKEIFKKTLEKDSPKGKFVFYDGPPFANGRPHYGHVLPGTVKDVIPRFKTMQGYHIDRQWGWDCHGLPVENFVQKEYNLQTSKDIENFGIENFSEKAKESVFRFESDWKEIMPRTGRWVDMDNPYTTMHPLYTQSVWWAFKNIYDKGLVYEDFRVMHVSPELETTLSNFEVNQGYKDIKDLSATAKFELEDEEGVYVLAWTTTPWTLPGNVALAVGNDIDYVKVKVTSGEKEKEGVFILAKELLSSVVKDSYEVIEEFKGSELVGKKYKPLFDYYSKEREVKNDPTSLKLRGAGKLEEYKNAWKIYPADFVTIEDGTGIVHIAPAFGEDDYLLSKEFNLPLIQHVKVNGEIKEEVKDFAGMQAKPKENPMQTDIEIVKFLAERGLLYSKEKYEHSYPHCWRTDAPLLNFATSSWFIKVTDIKNKLIANNNKVKWVPENVGSLRFGNWLKDARDWGISRSRYWGTPIPIWKSEDEKNVIVIGSLEDLKKRVKSSNKFFLVRHGESDHNVDKTLSEDNQNSPSHLTSKGEEETKKMAKKFKGNKIDLVYVSPLDRTKETVEILKSELDLKDDQIIVEPRIKEFQSGKNGMSQKDFWTVFGSMSKVYSNNEHGETLLEVRKRVGEFIEEVDSKNENKNILIISHDWPLWMIKAFCEGWSKEEAIEAKEKDADFIKTGDFLESDFYKLSHDKNYEIDLHRPYIDRVEFEEGGKKFKRIKDVFDGWVDSGSMPFASKYYPMKKGGFAPGSLLLKSKNFPADFIAEGLDQTRGWFYTLMVLNTALFGKSPFENVVVNGLVLAEDGRKMSKSLKNYPELSSVLDKYGADSLRYYLMNSPAVKADDLKFSEKGVDEVMKKIILRLDNVVTFFEMFKKTVDSQQLSTNSTNVLDKWILARLGEVSREVTNSLENYEIDRAARPFVDFVDDLSAWYLRRSRDRVKEGGESGEEAMQTLKYVLIEFSKMIAPFMPFKAEDVYQRLQSKKESVHLESWENISYKEDEILKDMEKTREIVTKALEKRASSGVKVRQPLQKLEVKNLDLSDEYLEIIKEEVNVKEVLNNESMMDEVVLDTRISLELKEEGNAREIMRAIQDLRKKSKLNPEDEIEVSISYPNELAGAINKYEEDIKKTTKTLNIIKKELTNEPIKINEFEIRLEIVKK